MPSHPSGAWPISWASHPAASHVRRLSLVGTPVQHLEFARACGAALSAHQKAIVRSLP